VSERERESEQERKKVREKRKREREREREKGGGDHKWTQIINKTNPHTPSDSAVKISSR
jgi:hypothetical protein